MNTVIVEDTAIAKDPGSPTLITEATNPATHESIGITKTLSQMEAPQFDNT